MNSNEIELTRDRSMIYFNAVYDADKNLYWKCNSFKETKEKIRKCSELIEHSEILCDSDGGLPRRESKMCERLEYGKMEIEKGYDHILSYY